MALSREEVEHIAQLARVGMTDEEMERIAALLKSTLAGHRKGLR